MSSADRMSLGVSVQRERRSGSETAALRSPGWGRGRDAEAPGGSGGFRRLGRGPGRPGRGSDLASTSVSGSSRACGPSAATPGPREGAEPRPLGLGLTWKQPPPPDSVHPSAVPVPSSCRPPPLCRPRPRFQARQQAAGTVHDPETPSSAPRPRPLLPHPQPPPPSHTSPHQPPGPAGLGLQQAPQEEVSLGVPPAQDPTLPGPRRTPA